MTTYILEPVQELTPEQKREIAEAKKRPITFDEDCPEITPEIAALFRRASDIRNLDSVVSS